MNILERYIFSRDTDSLADSIDNLLDRIDQTNPKCQSTGTIIADFLMFETTTEEPMTTTIGRFMKGYLK